MEEGGRFEYLASESDADWGGSKIMGMRILVKGLGLRSWGP